MIILNFRIKKIHFNIINIIGYKENTFSLLDFQLFQNLDSTIILLNIQITYFGFCISLEGENV